MNRNSTKEQLDRAYSILSRADVPDDVADQIRSELRDVITKLSRRDGEGAYARYVSDVIGREYERKRRGERERPLCACSDPLCPLSDGRLPPQLRPQHSRYFGNRTSKELIDEYEETHPEAIILRDARREYEETGAEIDQQLIEITHRLKQYRERAAVEQFTAGDAT